MVLKQSHWKKTCPIPSTLSKHCPALCVRRELVSCSPPPSRPRRRAERARARLTRYWQHSTCPHCSETMLSRLLALLVAPSRRNQAEKPSLLPLWMMR